MLKKIKEVKESIKDGRKEIKDLAAQRKKWEAAGSPGLEKKD